MSTPETPTDLPAAPTGTCPRCGGGNTKYRPAEVFCRTCDRAFTATSTDAGVAELVERLRVKIAAIRSLMATANALYDTSIYLGHAAELEECAAALAQQATQLQEARSHSGQCATCQEWTCGFCGISDGAGRWVCENCHGVGPMPVLQSQLTSLRAELETAQQAMRDAIVSMAISNYSTAENLLAAALAPTND